MIVNLGVCFLNHSLIQRKLTNDKSNEMLSHLFQGKEPHQCQPVLMHLLNFVIME